jgi:hypothetical protein
VRRWPAALDRVTLAVAADEAVPVTGPSGRDDFQLCNLLEDLTVADNVPLPPQLPQRKIGAGAAELPDRYGIGKYRHSYPGRPYGRERAER